MRALVISMALVLVGCSTQPKQEEPKAPLVVSNVIDTECAGLAKYARAVAILRDINVAMEDVNFILPKRTEYPISAIQRAVYFKTDSDPASTSIDIYFDCVTMGYDHTIAKYRKDDAVFIKDQESLIKTELEKIKPKGKGLPKR